MATSGQTIVLNSTSLDLVTQALLKLGVLQIGNFPNDNQYLFGLYALNNLVSEFRALGMLTWKRYTYRMPLVNFQYEYILDATMGVPYPTYIYSMELEQGPQFDTQISLEQKAITDFNLLPSGSRGVPVAYNYQPTINQGLVRLWPTPDTSVPVGSRVKITYQSPTDIYTALDGPETMDFPQEWMNALVYNLAVSLSDEYGIPETKKTWLERQADKHLNLALSISNEQGSLFLQPNWNGEGFNG